MYRPRYPIYIMSKGRHDNALTPGFLIEDGVPFKLVVEPQEADDYAAAYGGDKILVLPFANLGLGSIPARNWIWEHAKASGADRHWVVDDNIREVRRQYKGKRIRCPSGPAFAAVEDFCDRYENIAIGGMNSQAFGLAQGPAVRLNCHVYSCMLLLTSLPYRWRGRYNEDVDLCFQALAEGWCTIQTNIFQINKMCTMTMKGGNTDELYVGDGRLEMANSLARQWPHLVKVRRRFGRPQHVINWNGFHTPLKPKPGIDLTNMAANEYGLRLAATGEVKSPRLKRLLLSPEAA